MSARFEVDDELARRAGAGDQKAMEMLMTAWLEPTASLARWMCRRAPEDAAQAALMELYSVARSGYFVGRPAPGADARTIARRAVFRACAKQQNDWSGAEEFREPADGRGGDPARQKLRQDIDALIDELPSDLAITLRLMLADWKASEIADELGISPETVRSRRASIKRRIGDRLAEMLQGETNDG